MAPPPIPADFLSKRSTHNSNIILIIVFLILGGASVMIFVIIIFIISKRRSRVPQHSRNLSETSTTSLLRRKSQWREKSSTPPLDRFPVSPNRIHRNDSTDSLATIIPFQGEQAETQSREATPLLSSDLRLPKPTLPPLVIPSHSPLTPSHPEQPTEVSSSGSASSGSLYSQPSPSTSHVVTPPERKPSLPKLLPPPQYAYIRPDTGDVPIRADTRKIGKLLKERAKRNERKLTRGVSRIERTGSINPVFNSDDSDDDSDPIHRPRHSKTKRNSAAALIPLRTSEEWSNIPLVTR